MPVLILVVLGLASIAASAAQVAVMVRSRQRQKTWFATTAEVTRVHMESRGSNDTQRTVMVGAYEYYDRNEQKHSGSGVLGRQGLAVDGSTQVIDILVDPLDPTRSQIVQPASAVSLAGGVIGALFFGVIGVFVLLWAALMLGKG